MKTITMQSRYTEMLENFSKYDLIGSIFGGTNLLADYLNDYSSDSIETFLTEFKEGFQHDYITCEDIDENPNICISLAGSEFTSVFSQLFANQYDMSDYLNIIKNAKMYFDACTYANFYVFAESVSNACCNWYIIRANSENDAYEMLECEFEKDFIVDLDDYTIEECEEYGWSCNDNGNYVNLDTVVFIGAMSFHK